MKNYGWMVITKDEEMKTGTYLAHSEQAVENFLMQDPQIVSCLVLEEISGTLPCRYCGKHNETPQEFCGIRCIDKFVEGMHAARAEDGPQPEDKFEDARLDRAIKFFEKPCIVCGKPCIRRICSDACMYDFEMREAVEQSEVR